MSDLTKISEELFWVLLKEEVGDFGVLQAPRPTAVGHNGEREGCRCRQELSGSATATPKPPPMAHLQDKCLICVQLKDKDRKFSIFLHFLFLLCHFTFFLIVSREFGT